MQFNQRPVALFLLINLKMIFSSRYSADLNYPNKTRIFKRVFFSNWVKIRQKVERSKVDKNFLRTLMMQLFLRNSQPKF